MTNYSRVGFRVLFGVEVANFGLKNTGFELYYYVSTLTDKLTRLTLALVSWDALYH